MTSHLKVKDHEEADSLFNSRTTGPKNPHTTIGRNYSATEIALYNDRIRKKNACVLFLTGLKSLIFKAT